MSTLSREQKISSVAFWPVHGLQSWTNVTSLLMWSRSALVKNGAMSLIIVSAMPY